MRACEHIKKSLPMVKVKKNVPFSAGFSPFPLLKSISLPPLALHPNGEKRRSSFSILPFLSPSCSFTVGEGGEEEDSQGFPGAPKREKEEREDGRCKVSHEDPPNKKGRGKKKKEEERKERNGSRGKNITRLVAMTLTFAMKCSLSATNILISFSNMSTHKYETNKIIFKNLKQKYYFLGKLVSFLSLNIETDSFTFLWSRWRCRRTRSCRA
jgi:hypothetical protein